MSAMQYRVRGVWKLSGEIAMLHLSADDEEAARSYADAVGVIALDVEPEMKSPPETGGGLGGREETVV